MSLRLRDVLSSVHSTPDGSCLLVSSESEHGAKHMLTEYHQNSVGAREGTKLNIPDLPVGESSVVTSLISRSSVHLMWLDSSAHKCQSYALDITNQITGFMFQEKVSRGPPNKKTNSSAHNFLID